MQFASASLRLQVGVLALKVGQAGLQALQATSAALDLYEQIIEPHTSKQEGVQPVPPDTPQMLPSIHAIWSPLIGALKVGAAAQAGTKLSIKDIRKAKVFVNMLQ